MPASAPPRRALSAAVRGRLALLVAMTAYVAMSIAMFAHVLTGSLSRSTTCACSDASLFTWFFEWPLVALTHGHSPVFSTAMFHPQGINLLSNTSVLAWSMVLLPVTAWFGPLASLNVALVAAPVLSATAAMWVARRWVRSSAAAFVAGALYGFSPLVLFQSAGAHLMATSLFIAPLVLACFDELFFRRHRSRLGVGIGLGLLVAVQFFLGTELLVMMLVATAISLVVVFAGAIVADRRGALRALWAGAPGLGIAVAVAAVLLAWPTWYALDGPSHLPSVIWPGTHPAQASLRSFLVAVPGQRLWWVPSWGRFMRPTYLGPPLVGTLLAGTVAFRKDRRLLAMSAAAVVVAWLALGQHYAFAAWHYVDHVVVLRNVMNERFSGLLFLPVGIALALILDHVVAWRPSVPALGSIAAGCLAAACISPFVLDASRALPYAASPVWEPAWYRDVANGLPKNQVILGFPMFNTTADLLAVQALHAMHYAVAGGTGPEWLPARQGAEARGYKVLWQLSSLVAAPIFDTKATPPQARAVRDALRGWGVTLVVDPMQAAPNTDGVARPPWDVAVWLSSVLGAPSTAHGAWVWRLAPSH